MAAAKEPSNLPLDPHVDPILHSPGEPVSQPEAEVPYWPECQFPPKEQSDG